jgi:hypothetical protein
MKPVEQETLPIFEGVQHQIYCPDGRIVTMRETNGNDDEILSKLGDAGTGESVYRFLADIIEEDSELKRKPMARDIEEYPVNTKYFLLMAQRLINKGDTMEVNKHPCINTRCFEDKAGTRRTKNDFVINLREDHYNEFDVSKKGYDPEADGKNKPKLYPKGLDKSIEFVSSSGKKFKFDICTGVHEKEQLAESADAQSQNSKLRLRKLQIWNNDQWQLVTNFHWIRSKEMDEIRAYIDKYDTLFDPLVELTCPKCKMSDYSALLGMTAFYFPVPKI